jgi:hypothetical protein
MALTGVLSIKVNYKDFLDFAEDTGHSMEYVGRAIMGLMVRVTAKMYSDTVANAPSFMGILRGSVNMQTPKAVITSDGMRVESSIFSPLTHAVVQDVGRGPGKPMPNLADMLRYVTLKHARGEFTIHVRKGEPLERAAVRAAFVLARSIGAAGTTGRRFFTEAVAAAQIRLTQGADDIANGIINILEFGHE